MAKTPRSPGESGFRPLGCFFLRTPLLPLEALDAARSEDGDNEPALRALFDENVVEAALLLASPSLHERLRESAGHPLPADVKAALGRYVGRMATRTTPFSILAAISVGSVASTETRLDVEPGLRVRARLDHETLGALTRRLSSDRTIRLVAPLECNRTVHVRGDRVMFDQSLADGYRQAEFERSEALDICVRTGDAPFGRHVEALIAAEFDEEASVDFVHEMIDAGLLAPALGMSTVGDEPLDVLLRELAALPATVPAVAQAVEDLGRTRHLLERFGERPSVATLATLEASLAPLVDAEASKGAVESRIQADASRSAPSLTLAKDIAEKVARAAATLEHVTPWPVDEAFQELRERFADRFGPEPIPLLAAFDPALGLRFEDIPEADAVLIKGLPWSDDTRKLTWGPRDTWLAERAADVTAGGSRGVLELDDDDLAALHDPDKPPPPPRGCAAVATLLPEGASESIHLKWIASGSYGTEMVSRFRHGDAGIDAACAKILERDDEHLPNVVHAELAFQSTDKIVNLCQRPMARRYYLPCGGRASAGERLDLEDLVLLLTGGRFRLLSRRLGCEVVPVSSANFEFRNPRCPPLVRFLGQLARNGRSPVLHWSWGSLGFARSYLPRVVHRGVVFTRACWLLRKPGLEKRTGLERYLRDRDLPRHVVAVDSDREIPVDLGTAEGIEHVTSQLRNADQVVLREDVDRDPARARARLGAKGAAHDFILPLERKAPPRPAELTSAVAIRQRRFLPSDRWAMAKLYGSSSSLDTVLRDKLDGLLESLPPHGWFFIRYSDPDVHLRLRFRPEEPGDDASVRGRVEAWAVELERSGWIRRFAWDTYDRETARYGGDEVIEDGERFFGADSRFAVATRSVGCSCEHLQPVPAPALFSGCALLTSLGFSPAEATAQVLEPFHQGRLRETGRVGDASAFLSKTARDHRATLRAIASLGGHAPECPVRPFEDAWFAAGQKLGASLRAAGARGALTYPLPTIAQSLLHMHYNRIAVGNPRLEELPLVNLSIRIFGERAARGRAGGPGPDG